MSWHLSMGRYLHTYSQCITPYELTLSMGRYLHTYSQCITPYELTLSMGRYLHTYSQCITPYELTLSMGRYLHTYSQCITPHELTFWFQHMIDVFKTTLFWWGCQGLFAGWWFSEGIPLINLTQKYKLRYICIWCQTPTNPWGSLISSTSKKYWLPK
jgi:hypothetical protein